MITADDLSFTAVAQWVRRAHKINTTVAEVLAGSSTGEGDIWLNEADGVTLTSLTNANGLIDVTADGTITVDNAVAVTNVVTTVGAGTIALTANGVAASIVVNDGIQSVNAAITLLAGHDVTFAADGDVTSSAGNVTVTAESGVANSGALTMVDGTVINAGSGKIDLNADEDITLGRLVTTDSSDTAVTIDSTEGGLVDSGDTGGADIAAAGRVVINTVTGVGHGGAIETNVDSLDIDNATSGNIDISETNAVTVFHAQQAAAGDIQISAGGTITVSNGTPGSNVVSTVDGGTITLATTAAASKIAVNSGIQSGSGRYYDHDFRVGRDWRGPNDRSRRHGPVNWRHDHAERR